MRDMTTRRAQPDRRRGIAARRVLPSLLLTVVAFGVLVMHGLGSHANPTGHTAIAWPAATSVVTIDEPVSADAATARGQASSLAQHDHDTPGHVGVAVACAFILLIALFILTAPQGRTVPLRNRPRWSVVQGALVAGAWRRPPSLHMLCVSRT